MTGSRGSSLLPHLRQLELHDERLAVEIEAVTALLERADEVRARAAAIREALAGVPAELDHLDRAHTQAREHEAHAGEELAAAERRMAELEARRRGRGQEAKAQARRELQRAREALADATARVERLVARRADVLEDERRLRADGETQVAVAREVAAAIRRAPRISDSGKEEPGGKPDEIEEWGARAHAALFVVRGVLEAERERIVTEANTIAASVLGENVSGATVALVRRRLEDAVS